MRLGMKRLIDEFSSRGIPVGASINAGVIDIYPECAEAVRAAGWEFIAHGMYQKAIQGEADEAGLIGAVLEKIEAFTGKRPRAGSAPACAKATQRQITSPRTASNIHSIGTSTTYHAR